MVIDPDDPTTWPAAIAAQVTALARSQPGTADIVDLRFSDADEIGFPLLFHGHLVRTYHCTRLLDHERDMVRRGGLRLSSAKLVTDRLTAALQAGLLTSSEFSQFGSGRLHATPLAHGPGRAGQLHLILSEDTFETDADGVRPLLANWGGEVVYRSNLQHAHRDRLAALGRPAIVVAHLDVQTDGPFVSPGLAAAFVAKHLGLENLGAVVCCRGAVPPSRIEDIWQPGDPGYDRHRRLPPT